MRKLTEQEKIEYERLVKGATQITMELVREKTGKTLCTKCLKETSYREETRKISYSFNSKDIVLIDGIVRYCNICGMTVDVKETILLNEQIALNNVNKTFKAADICLHGKSASTEEITGLQDEVKQTSSPAAPKSFEYDIAENGQMSLVF